MEVKETIKSATNILNINDIGINEIKYLLNKMYLLLIHINFNYKFWYNSV